MMGEPSMSTRRMIWVAWLARKCDGYLRRKAIEWYGTQPVTPSDQPGNCGDYSCTYCGVVCPHCGSAM